MVVQAPILATYEGRRRVVIEAVTPQVDGGRFPIKRTLGEEIAVEADVFADGHDAISVMLLYKAEAENVWHEQAMLPLGNDHWSAVIVVQSLGNFHYTVAGWIDDFLSWRRDFEKKVEAGQEVSVDLLVGAELVRAAAQRAPQGHRTYLERWAEELANADGCGIETRITRARDSVLGTLAARYPDRSLATRYDRELIAWVEPERARFSAWYEIFPRSAGSDGIRHGTLSDVEAQLPRIAGMGFDVVYLPPIHPIGHAFRKGKNNSAQAELADPGSPWAIGDSDGGHKSVHRQLGTVDDFARLLGRARTLGIEIALDIALQCSPDHPYVREHPDWFRRRPDGTIQYAENPPKRYQDIYPFDFESEAWGALWIEAKNIFEYWIQQGVRIFRVDNPHTKAFPFWEWCISELKRSYPELVFLSEAFTRPKVKYYLAKLGFTQSYSYFPWRNTAEEIRAYFTELTRTPVREFFRPSLWPNTPDILPEALQIGGRPAFVIRFILAATLGPSYGIYGPAYELCVNTPLNPGGEEYMDSEKYQLKAWELNRPESLRPLIERVNRIRRENRALHSNDFLAFHEVDNPQIIAYSKRTRDLQNIVLVIVNLDPHNAQEGSVELDLDELGIRGSETFETHDLLTGARACWRGTSQRVRFEPLLSSAAIYRLRRRVSAEDDFEYFL